MDAAARQVEFVTLRLKFIDGSSQESLTVTKIVYDGSYVRVHREGRERPAAFPIHTIAYMEWLAK